jgi:hypothetical protein
MKTTLKPFAHHVVSMCCLATGLALVLAAGGCLPLSVKPLYQPEAEPTLDKRLLGTWAPAPAQGEEAGNEKASDADDRQAIRLKDPIGQWTVKRHGELPGRYKIVARDEDGQQAGFIGTLVTLGERHFLNLKNTAMEPTPNIWALATRPPAHAFVQIRFADQQIEIATVHWGRFQRLLESKPDLIAHTTIEGPSRTSGQDFPLITAETPELRAFVTKHLPDDPYFAHWHPMKRVKPAATQAKP